MTMMMPSHNPPRSSVQKTLRTKTIYQERPNQKPAPSEGILTLTSLLFDCSKRRPNHQGKAWNQVILGLQKVQGQVKISPPITTIENFGKTGISTKTKIITVKLNTCILKLFLSPPEIWELQPGAWKIPKLSPKCKLPQ